MPAAARDGARSLKSRAAPGAPLRCPKAGTFRERDRYRLVPDPYVLDPWPLDDRSRSVLGLADDDPSRFA